MGLFFFGRLCVHADVNSRHDTQLEVESFAYFCSFDGIGIRGWNVKIVNEQLSKLKKELQVNVLFVSNNQVLRYPKVLEVKLFCMTCRLVLFKL